MLGGCRLLRVGSGAAEDPHQSFRLIWLSKREGLCWCACGWHAINLQHVATIISLRFYPARGTRAWEQLCGINGVEGDGVPSTQVRTYVLHFMLLTVVRVHSGSTLLHVLYCTCLVGLAKPTCACAGQREAVKNLLCARVAAKPPTHPAAIGGARSGQVLDVAVSRERAQHASGGISAMADTPKAPRGRAS